MALGIATGLAFCGSAVRLMRKTPAVGIPLYLAGIGSFYFSIFYGSVVRALFSPLVALSAAMLAVVFSGALAVRNNSQFGFCAVYLLGVVTPLVIRGATLRYDWVLGYLIAMMLVAMAIVYRLKREREWMVLRGVAVMSTSCVVLIAIWFMPEGYLQRVLVLTILSYLVSLTWIWLPFRKYNSFTWLFLWLFNCIFSMAAVASTFA